jgi:transposase
VRAEFGARSVARRAAGWDNATESKEALMKLTVRQEGDLERLDALIAREKDAMQRDRLRAARLALDGEEALAAAATLGRSRRFVQEWAYTYRDGGVEAIRPGRSGGRPTKLPREKEQAFRERMLGGVTGADGGVCSLRGVDAMRILEQEFGARYTLDGVYDLLHRLRLSCLVPRPRHRKNDPHVMQQWLDDAPLLSKA